MSTAVAPERKARFDEDLDRLKAQASWWANASYASKLAILKDMRWRVLDNGEECGRVAAAIMGEAGNAVTEAAEMFGGMAVSVLYLNKLILTFESLVKTGAPPKLEKRELPNGQTALKVWPITSGDKRLILLPGVEAEVYLQPGKPVSQGAVYTGAEKHGGRLCAVLGAGNHGFLALKDALYCLFERNEVCALRPHPIQQKWCDAADHIMAPLVEAGVYRNMGYLEGVAETAALLHDSRVECVHMTGGTATHDAIVWGPSAEERARRKAADDPLLKKGVTSELGCVTPWVVTPGKWTEQQLETQARNVALGFTSNNSCNCNAAKVLVLPAGWEQADAFLDRVRATIAKCPMQPAYYPGIRDRYQAWKAQYPKAEEIKAEALPCSEPAFGEPLPYLLNVIDVPQDPSKEYCLQVEPFAPVLSAVKLPGGGGEGNSGPEFLKRAVAFANDHVWGTLSCTLLLHPEFEKAHPAEVQQALIDLRYGTVSINSWSGMSYCLGTTPWGAFGGDQTTKDVGSGIGHIGNSLLIDNVQKTVYRCPIVGQAVPQPLYMQPVGKGLVKAVCGYLAGGLAGVAKALLYMR